jgi:nickel/cobalt exporter
MNSAVLTTIALTGFTVAFFHAAIPTHWLPFVLVARSRKWSRAKTLAVSTFAGLGHVALTTALGLAIAWFGLQFDHHVAEEWLPKITGGVLLLIAIFYFWRQFTGRGLLHHHTPGGEHEAGAHCGHEHGHSHFEEELKDAKLMSVKTGDWPVISGLFLMLTLSPCEGFLPVYLSGIQFGWPGFILLSVILAVGTLAGMLLFTWLTLIGVNKLPIQKFERYEAAMLGGIFFILSMIMLFVDHRHLHFHDHDHGHELHQHHDHHDHDHDHDHNHSHDHGHDHSHEGHKHE